MFRRYHYLNHEINKSTQCYIGLINNIPAAFCAVLHFPHPKVRNFKMISRLVVMPDYQGIGIGGEMLNSVAKYYKSSGFRVIITTSNPALRSFFNSASEWITKRISRVPLFGNSGRAGYRQTISNKRITGSYEFLGAKR